MSIEHIIANAAFVALSFHVSLKWGWYNRIEYILQSRWGKSICVLCVSFWLGCLSQVVTAFSIKIPYSMYEILTAGALAVVFTLASLKV